ncbi:MAG TPA: iron-containing alcohol dehydrogenase [Myxococcota bacterium]|nr:iron-containing alcohol dehydrogenase [Myxococcota bacterium]HOD00288.1 iron-containing alcohol dehydrogenase [Myxococcota bacterium]HOH77876.1 iron-containing alcohol dehydrogenase [Myxococcota bacterium]HPV04378.1 iron-containing alcohol dehydrogenase [Myxococcota bacterium]
MKFEYSNPVQVVFGPGRISELGKLTAGIGNRAVVVIGGGSVRNNGTLDKAVKSLEAARVAIHVFEGVEPNPRISTVRRGIDAIRAFRGNVVIALGGGSVMDAAKVMAAGALYDQDPWKMCKVSQAKPVAPTASLPVITVPTLAATGSEMNCNAVITNWEANMKAAAIYPILYPKLALIDPELTVTVPKYHTAAGVVDIITHVTEGYFNAQPGTPLQDRMAEAVISTAIEHGARAVADGSDLAAREAVMWASTVALNNWIHVGWNAPFPCHGIEHVLSAHYDVSHGAGLAAISPSWMRFVVRRVGPGKWAGFARRVMAVDCADDVEAALLGIDRLEEFFASIGAPTRLSGLGIPAAEIRRLAEDTVRVFGVNGAIAGVPPLTVDDIESILNSAA